MSTNVLEAPYSSPSPADTSSSTTMSPAYPDRPIRPMPRRSLRDRLSPEIADTIDYPPTPATSSNMFYAPYAEAMAQRNGTVLKNALREMDNAVNGSHGVRTGDEDIHSYRIKSNELDSEDEDDSGHVRTWEEHQQRSGVMASIARNLNGMARNAEAISQSVASSSDSVDGYDSFENTNNKKKRKIPTSGNMGNHHASFSTSLSQDLANMGLSGGEGVDTQDGSDGGLGHYYGTGSPAVSANSLGTGISGAGRGRFGRSGRREISGRGPLTPSMNGVNAWQHGRLGGARRDLGSMSSLGSKLSDTPSDHGIISQAIAEAAALPNIPSNGQENVSLLEQQSMKKSSPANSQFTFTCEAESSKGVVWPGDSNPTGGQPYHPDAQQSVHPSTTHPSNTMHNRKDFNTQGTQTSPTMTTQQAQNNTNPQAAAAPPKKPRRPAAKRYALAARNRRDQQQYHNYQHPPKLEDIWICEFCEYESIFGRPPEALIRQYEIKDQKERKRQAEKRRLLEKAKMKGRKGKKGTKNSNKGNNNAAQQQAANYHPPNDHVPAVSRSANESDDYYADEYDNEPNVPMPPPSETASRNSQPVPQQPGQSAKTSHGTGTHRPD